MTMSNVCSCTNFHLMWWKIITTLYVCNSYTCWHSMIIHYIRNNDLISILIINITISVLIAINNSKLPGTQLAPSLLASVKRAWELQFATATEIIEDRPFYARLPVHNSYSNITARTTQQMLYIVVIVVLLFHGHQFYSGLWSQK